MVEEEVTVRLLTGDCRVTLAQLEPGSIQAAITSPPYYGLRDYGLEPLVWGGQPEHEHEWGAIVGTIGTGRVDQGRPMTAPNAVNWSRPEPELVRSSQGAYCACGAWRGAHGLEPTPELYIAHELEVFRAVWRVLRADGTVWLNLGDSMSGSGKGPTGYNGLGNHEQRQGFVGSGSGGRVYGRTGKAQSDYQGDDSFSSGLCDECQEALSRRNADTETLLVHESIDGEADPSLVRNQSDDSSPDSSGSGHRRLSGQSYPATPDRQHSSARVTAPLRASRASMPPQSEQQLQAVCSHCDNCGVCLSVLRSASRDSQACARRSVYSDGTARPAGSWDYRRLGTELSSTAYPDSTTTLPAKNLMMMPFRVAMALQADGWYVRSVIPWLKRNSMPESVRDRPASAVEYVFLLSKAERYFWDADAVRENLVSRPQRYLGAGRVKEYEPTYAAGGNGLRDHRKYDGVPQGNPAGRSRRNSDWFFESWQGLELDEDGEPLALVVNPSPYKGAHYATFPPKLVEPMVKASTSERGQCPECGAPWVRVVERANPPTVQTPAQIHLTTAQVARTGGAKSGGTNSTTFGVPAAYMPEHRTTGWQPTCAHADLTPVAQTVLDCFAGSGTVGVVADRLGRDAILCELKPSYVDQAEDRVTNDAPLFVQLTMA